MSNERSFKFVMHRKDTYPNYQVVHGFLRSRNEESWDPTYPMAWLESDQFVITDMAGKSVFEREDFYRRYNPTFLNRYSQEEAIEKQRHQGHAGPWGQLLKTHIMDEGRIRTRKVNKNDRIRGVRSLYLARRRRR